MNASPKSAIQNLCIEVVPGAGWLKSRMSILVVMHPVSKPFSTFFQQLQKPFARELRFPDYHPDEPGFDILAWMCGNDYPHAFFRQDDMRAILS